MKWRVTVCILAAAALVVWLLGCSASTQQTRSNMYSSAGDGARPTVGGGYGSTNQAKPAAQATVSEVDYFGWKAYKLTNGLVTLIAVPEIGGRIMEYKLGGHPFLWVNPAERGKVYQAAATEADRAWHNFGGYKVWPAPQKDWGGPPDPLGSELDSGRWTGKIVAKSGAVATIEMTSPADAGVTGLQISRQVMLHAGTTRVTLLETFQNLSKRPVTWSIWGVTQVVGALDGTGKPSADAKVYLPLKQDSKHTGGFTLLAGKDSSQWKKVAGGHVLETSYAGETAKIGADSDGGWVAYVDDQHDVTFANTYSVTAGAAYPENSTVQVYTNAANAPYIEMEVLSPLKKLESGEKMTFTHNWYCAKVGGPITKVTEVAAVHTHPTAAKKGNQMIITGELGVFAPGELSVEFTNKEGRKVGASNPIKVTPATKVVLNLPAVPPDGAVEALVVLTANGSRLGSIAQVPLASGLAKAP